MPAAWPAWGTPAATGCASMRARSPGWSTAWRTCWGLEGMAPGRGASRMGLVRHQPVVLAAQRGGRLEESFLVAAVVALAHVGVTVDGARVQHGGDRVGKLDFAADAGAGAAQMIEDLGLEDISAHDRLIGRGFFGGGLFHDARDAR